MTISQSAFFVVHPMHATGLETYNRSFVFEAMECRFWRQMNHPGLQARWTRISMQVEFAPWCLPEEGDMGGMGIRFDDVRLLRGCTCAEFQGAHGTIRLQPRRPSRSRRAAPRVPGGRDSSPSGPNTPWNRRSPRGPRGSLKVHLRARIMEIGNKRADAAVAVLEEARATMDSRAAGPAGPTGR